MRLWVEGKQMKTLKNMFVVLLFLVSSLSFGMVMKGQKLSEDKILKLLHAIAIVETGDVNDAINEEEMAFGKYQITKIAIDDINRIIFERTGLRHVYEIKDALNEESAKIMAKIYLHYWGEKYEKRTGEFPNEEVYARIWNGGPYGYLKESTVNYWERVKNTLEVINE